MQEFYRLGCLGSQASYESYIPWGFVLTHVRPFFFVHTSSHPCTAHLFINEWVVPIQQFDKSTVYKTGGAEAVPTLLCLAECSVVPALRQLIFLLGHKNAFFMVEKTGCRRGAQPSLGNLVSNI